MKRRKRFAIRLVALGFALTALTAGPAQARLDEGLGYTWSGQGQQTMIAPDDRSDRVTPGPTSYVAQAQAQTQVLSADDLTGRVTPAPGQPSVVSTTDDGSFEWRTIGISAFVLLLGVAGAYLIIHQSQKGKLASA